MGKLTRVEGIEKNPSSLLPPVADAIGTPEINVPDFVVKIGIFSELSFFGKNNKYKK